MLNEWDYEANELPPSEYTNGSNVSVNWICSKCGYHFRAKIGNRTLLERGCPCCANKVVVPGINDLATTHPALAAEWHPTKNGELTPEKVTHGSGKKVWWLCPEGHEYQATILHRSGGTGCPTHPTRHRDKGTDCPTCNSGRQTSFAEQAVYYYVKKALPDTVNRYTAPWLERMELDIYIPSLKTGIEYDGMAWHKEDKHEREARKYRLCQQQGIKLLRLREGGIQSPIDHSIADECISIEGNMYEHDKLEATIRELIFTLDPLGIRLDYWTKLEFFQGPAVCIARDEKDIRFYMTQLRSGSLAEVHPELVSEWHSAKNGTLTPNKVKCGSDIKVWWTCPDCGNEYQASVSHRVAGTACPQCGKKRSTAKRSKAVQMIDMDTGEVIHTFPSISEASRQMNISSGNITAVCKGTGRKYAGGYYWSYLPSEDD